jgi:hypothetical protein
MGDHEGVGTGVWLSGDVARPRSAWVLGKASYGDATATGGSPVAAPGGDGDRRFRVVAAGPAIR